MAFKVTVSCSAVFYWCLSMFYLNVKLGQIFIDSFLLYYEIYFFNVKVAVLCCILGYAAANDFLGDDARLERSVRIFSLLKRVCSETMSDYVRNKRSSHYEISRFLQQTLTFGLTVKYVDLLSVLLIERVFLRATSWKPLIHRHHSSLLVNFMGMLLLLDTVTTTWRKSRFDYYLGAIQRGVACLYD